MQHALKLIDVTHMRSNYAAKSLCPPTLAAHGARSRPDWQCCLIPVFFFFHHGTWSAGGTQHPEPPIYEGMLPQAACELNPQTATTPEVERQTGVPYSRPTDALLLLIYFTSMFEASLPPLLPFTYPCRPQRESGGRDQRCSQSHI